MVPAWFLACMKCYVVEPRTLALKSWRITPFMIQTAKVLSLQILVAQLLFYVFVSLDVNCNLFHLFLLITFFVFLIVNWKYCFIKLKYWHFCIFISDNKYILNRYLRHHFTVFTFNNQSIATRPTSFFSLCIHLGHLHLSASTGIWVMSHNMIYSCSFVH